MSETNAIAARRVRATRGDVGSDVGIEGMALGFEVECVERLGELVIEARQAKVHE